MFSECDWIWSTAKGNIEIQDLHWLFVRKETTFEKQQEIINWKVSWETERISFCSNRKVGKENESWGNGIRSEVNENKMGNLKQREKKNLGKSRICKETARMFGLYYSSWNSSLSRTETLRPILKFMNYFMPN